MGLLDRIRKQKATYWQRTGTDAFGKSLFAESVTLDVRWDETMVKFLNKTGQEVLSRALVIVGQDMAIDDVLMSGELGTPDTTPFNHLEAWEIRQFERIPDRRNRKIFRQAYL